MTETHSQHPTRYGFQALLIALVVMMLVTPALLTTTKGGILFEATISIILILSVYAIGNERHIWFPIALVVPSLTISWMVYFHGAHPDLRILSAFLSMLLFLYVPWVLIRYLFRQKEASLNIVYAAMCGYLLLGLMWALLCTLLEWYQPGSFEGLTITTVKATDGGLLIHHFESFLYYSFVTLTTLGYGDVTPVLPQARAFAITETVLAQFYLTVLLGRLIGMYIQKRS